MKAIFSADPDVPLTRALGDHRAWLLPLALVIVINAVVLLLVVMPLARAVQGNEARERAAEGAQARAAQELTATEALRDGKAQATSDLDVFYREVLPADVASARRLTHVRLAQMADAHRVLYERGNTTLERVEDSTLERLRVSMSLTGEYADVRAFLHALETADAFVVIDNMVLAEGADAGNRLSLTLDVSTYYPASADAP